MAIGNKIYIGSEYLLCVLRKTDLKKLECLSLEQLKFVRRRLKELNCSTRKVYSVNFDILVGKGHAKEISNIVEILADKKFVGRPVNRYCLAAIDKIIK